MSDDEQEVFEEEDEDFDDDDDDDDEELDEAFEEGTIEDIAPIETDVDVEESPYQAQFKENMRNDYVQKFHPEEIHKPFEEIHKLTIITRDEKGNIVDELHKTYPILSKYEKTRAIGIRVTQLNKGAKPYTELKRNILDNALIAEKELKEKKLPFIIMRPMPNGICEYWNINDLEQL
jgi:DNA-directed RNA polymerase I, II, and III subunit RPABC2